MARQQGGKTLDGKTKVGPHAALPPCRPCRPAYTSMSTTAPAVSAVWVSETLTR